MPPFSRQEGMLPFRDNSCISMSERACGSGRCVFCDRDVEVFLLLSVEYSEDKVPCHELSQASMEVSHEDLGSPTLHLYHLHPRALCTCCTNIPLRPSQTLRYWSTTQHLYSNFVVWSLTRLRTSYLPISILEIINVYFCF